MRSINYFCFIKNNYDQQLQPLSDYELKNIAPALKNMRFRITQSWSVRTTPAGAAKVLDIAVKAGANQSGSIGWQMKDDSLLVSQAAAKALAHAQVIAARMAEGLHIHVGQLLFASNEAEQAAPGRIMTMAARPLNGRALVALKPLSISRRRITRSATVYAIFSVE